MKTIGIYPGNFQPPHRGHLRVFKTLKQLVGPETFVVTTSHTPTPDSPLNFGEKENIWVRHGVPAGHIVKVEDWKHPQEVFHKFSPKHTSAVFVLNKKEFESLHVRSGVVDDKTKWLGNDGQPHYFQPHKGNESNMESFEKHGYVRIMEDNNIDGKPVSTANIRAGLGSPKYTDEQKKKFFQWAFGWFDIGLFQELSDKFKMAHSSSDMEEVPVAMPSLTSLIRPVQSPNNVPNVTFNDPKKKLQKAIKEIVAEILEDLSPSPSMTPSGDLGLSDMAVSPEDQRKELMKARQDATKEKSETERELETMKRDLRWKKADSKRKEKDEIPNTRRKLDALNKAIATGQFSNN